MPRCAIILFGFVFLLTACGQADYDSAKAAYKAGNYETAYKKLLPLAKAGDAKAQNLLGVMYSEGLSVEQEYTEAFKWFQKSAEQGFVESQYNLGVMYHEGLGVQQNYTESIQ